MYLGPKIVAVYKALFSEFREETNRKRFEACYFLGIWVVKLDCTAQAYFSALHKYSLAYLRRAVYKKCTLCLHAIIYVHAPNNRINGWSLVNCLLCFSHYLCYFFILDSTLLRTIPEQNYERILDSLRHWGR